MQSLYVYQIKYNNKHITYVHAKDKWEAIDKVIYKLVLDIPNINRTKIKAIKKK